MQTERLLDGSSYSGPAFGSEQAPASLVTRAIFDGCMVCRALPRSEVERALPAELRLPSGPPNSDRHPVLFLFGEQARGATRVGNIDVQWGIAYQELIVAVPFVAPQGSGRLCVYVTAMYSSYYLSNWEGSVAYGFQKRLAAAGWRGPIYAVTTPEDGLVFQASVEPASSWRRATEAPPSALSALERISALPWLGRKPNGVFVQSRSLWLLDAAQARSVEACVMLHVPPAVGLPTGRYEPVRGGGVEVRGMVWWLSWPRSFAF